MKRVYSRTREDTNAVVVDWNLGNTCSVKCQYCDPWFHRGNNPFPDIEAAKHILDVIAERHRSSNRPLALSLVGGEPSEWRNLAHLCQHADMAGFSVSIASNGLACEATWRPILPYIRALRLTHHLHTDWNAVLNTAERARASFANVTINFAMTPERFEVGLDRYRIATSRGFACHLQPLYWDHTRRTNALPYSPEQLSILFPNQAGDLVQEHANAVQTSTVEKAIHDGANSFTGMRCGIGIDQIVIDQDGTIRGGWCRVGDVLGRVDQGDFAMPDDGVICTRQRCTNPLDLAVPKWSDD